MAIKVREKRSSARGLPLQTAAEPGAVDADQHEIGLAAEMFRGGYDHLVGGGEMDVAIAPVGFRAVESPGTFGLLPLRAGTNLEDEAHARGVYVVGLPTNISLRASVHSAIPKTTLNC